MGLASLSHGLVHQLPLLVSVNDYFSLLDGAVGGDRGRELVSNNLESQWALFNCSSAIETG